MPKKKKVKKKVISKKLKEFQKFKKIKPKNIDDIYELRDYVNEKLINSGI